MSNQVKVVRNALVNGMFGNPRTIGGMDGLLSRMVPFVSTSKNLSAERLDGRPLHGVGYSWLERHRQDVVRAENYIYVVWCFGTPIATVRDDGYLWTATRHDLRDWSQTTTHHVRKAQAWLGDGQCPCGYASYLECAVARVKEETDDTPRSWLIMSDDHHI